MIILLKCSVEVLTNFAKRSILDVWQGSEYTFLLGRNGSTVAKLVPDDLKDLTKIKQHANPAVCSKM